MMSILGQELKSMMHVFRIGDVLHVSMVPRNMMSPLLHSKVDAYGSFLDFDCRRGSFRNRHSPVTSLESRKRLVRRLSNVGSYRCPTLNSHELEV